MGLWLSGGCGSAGICFSGGLVFWRQYRNIGMNLTKVGKLFVQEITLS